MTSQEQKTFNIIHIVSGNKPHKEAKLILTTKSHKEAAIHVFEKYILPNSEQSPIDGKIHQEYKDLLEDWKQAEKGIDKYGDEVYQMATHAPSQPPSNPDFYMSSLADLIVVEAVTSFDYHYYFESGVTWDTLSDLEITIFEH